MSDGRDTGRRGGFLTIAALVLLAFLLGGVATTLAVRSGRWFMAPTPAPVATPSIVVKPLVQAPPPTAVAATVDPATLAVREGVLAGQLAALEARTAAISADALAAGGQAGRAEALLVAAAARRALDRGVSLGYLEPELRARFAAAQPQAVQVVIDAAHAPLTREDLRQGLDAIAPDLTTGAGEGWWTVIRRQLGSLIVLRDAGTPSPLPADRLERAQRLLDGGQVEAARAEVARLPGRAARPSGSTPRTAMPRPARRWRRWRPPRWRAARRRRVNSFPCRGGFNLSIARSAPSRRAVPAPSRRR